MYADRYWDEPTEDPDTCCTVCKEHVPIRVMLDCEYDPEASFCDKSCKEAYDIWQDRCAYCNKVVQDGFSVITHDFCNDECYAKWACANVKPPEKFSFGRRD